MGEKNTAIKLMAASILTGKAILHNVPDITDILKLALILKKMGAKIFRRGHTLEIDTINLKATDPDPDLVRSIRASVILVGPLLARFGKVKIPHPGGCVIGARPIDLHLKAFRDLGVEIKESPDLYEFKIDHIGASVVSFETISVGATENLLMFASFFAESITLKNCAIEPGVVDLAGFLNKAGAKISFENRTISILGSKNLKAIEYTVIPDRIEAGTFAILAAATRSNLEINQVRTEHIGALLDKFRAIGVKFEIEKDKLYIKKSDNLKAIDISTAEYPGFPTDLQSPMGALLTQAHGKSHIRENIFENRLGYLEELKKMGANINIRNDREAEICGPTELSGARIESLDLRAGATLIIAGLMASSRTIIENAETIDRGYEKIEERLAKIGAKIQRVS